MEAPSTISRDGLIAAVMNFITSQGFAAGDDVRLVLEREIAHAAPDALQQLGARLQSDNGWGFYPRDPLAQRIHERLADRFLTTESRVVGLEHIPQMAAPIVMFSNHLSYSDANVIEVLLQRAGAGALANRLTALAGPKVFTSRLRRFSSLCFGTIKVPQSSDVSSGEAVMSSREVARASRQSIDAALERLIAGDALLLFGEGTRSRTAAMQPMLAAVSRYLEVPGTLVLPVGLVGSEQLYSIETSNLQPATVTLTIGKPISAEKLSAAASGDRRVIVDAIGLAIASLVPSSYRGVYGDTEHFCAAQTALSDTAS